ncbi:uncharacterized protein LOC110461286 [Mizuhopecten yessoensis]|uniref:uncharacterized protein LOC110461286 n=1 Tax=Mizuhopecten yessoensis TaxID=6573 RepID=UPI000B45AB74|nr:uncharacterized protein LOC110461286 [Mizuhopecten yessoensis]
MAMEGSFSEKDMKVITATLVAMGYKAEEGQLKSEELRSWIKSKEGAKDVKQEDDATFALPTPTITVNQPVRISIFSGEEKDTPYGLWKYEVESLLVSKDEDVVARALRRSVKGKAGTVVMHLGPTAPVKKILTKMDSIFGTVEKDEALLARLYSARQQDNEDASSWRCRLEDILNKAVSRREVTYTDTGDMLRTMFWTGLRRDLKDITGHKYDAIDDFDDLMIAVRQVEQDLNKRKEERRVSPSADDSKIKPSPAHMASAVTKDDLTEMKAMIKQLTTDMAKMISNEKQYSKSGVTKPFKQQVEDIRIME